MQIILLLHTLVFARIQAQLLLIQEIFFPLQKLIFAIKVNLHMQVLPPI